MVSPTIYLTGGHCTYGAEAVQVWFEDDINNRETSGYPFGGPTSISGTPYTHPEYNDAAFYLNDLGVVVLDEPVELDQYGVIQEEGYFEDFFVKRGQNKQEFTASPGRTSTSPCTSSATRAWRTDARLTPRMEAISRSGGSRPSAVSRSSWISDSDRSTKLFVQTRPLHRAQRVRARAARR